MEKGRIIFLNGVTSAGKTSIVEALQERDDIFFYVVANDLFQEMVGDKYLQRNYWMYLSEVIIMMYHTAKLYSDMGKNVLIDGILVERDEIKPHYQQLLEILKDNPLDIVEVYCPLEICRQRNIDRGDRYESQSEEQHTLMAENIAYSVRVDTSVQSSAECADIIVNTLFPKETSISPLGRDLIRNLHKSVEAFKKYKKRHYPQITEENDNGEWEIGIPQWDVMNSDYLWVIEKEKPESATEELLDDMLYVIARDSECSHLLIRTLDYPDWFEVLCRRSIKTDYYNAKWQFAEQLGHYEGESDIKELLFYFIESGDEYTERMALQSMCEHFPEQAEKYAVKFWERNIYPEDEYQKLMALYALHTIKSPLLKEYIAKAYETKYVYLKGWADEYSQKDFC